jgi:hypothetical protein
MSQRGRPRNPQPSVRVAIIGRLNPEYDADILAWLNAIPKGERMNAFKTVLRGGGLGLGLAIENGDQNEVQSAADDLLSNWEF